MVCVEEKELQVEAAWDLIGGDAVKSGSWHILLQVCDGVYGVIRTGITFAGRRLRPCTSAVTKSMETGHVLCDTKCVDGRTDGRTDGLPAPGNPHSVFCVLCGSENKQRLFPYTALTVWFL